MDFDFQSVMQPIGQPQADVQQYSLPLMYCLNNVTKTPVLDWSKGNAMGGNAREPLFRSSMDPTFDQFTSLTAFPEAAVFVSMNGPSYQTAIQEGTFRTSNASSRKYNSSDDTEDWTAAQRKRREQNRAAQRAFRERKEKRAKDLEANVTLLTKTTASLVSANEALRQKLELVRAENEILRDFVSSTPTVPVETSNAHRSPHERIRKSPCELSNSKESDANGTSPDRPQVGRKKSAFDFAVGRSFSANAVWDIVQSHPLYSKGGLDLNEVCERLSMTARRNGADARFEEQEVRTIIQGLSGGNLCA